MLTATTHPIKLEDCLRHAKEARRRAAIADNEESRAIYLELADVWEHMAITIRRNGLDPRGSAESPTINKEPANEQHADGSPKQKSA